jgi:hypothetical protein
MHCFMAYTPQVLAATLVSHGHDICGMDKIFTQKAGVGGIDKLPWAAATNRTEIG